MKINKMFLLALSSLTVLAGCGGNNSSPTTSDEMVQQAAKSQSIVLNLTSIGLYKGAKGTANTQYFLENTVSLTLSVGDALPGATDVTSTSTDVAFKTWVYYDKGGILSSTDKVIEDVFEYQAHFEFNGEFGNNGGSNPDDGGNTGSSDKIYFISQTWWQKDGATSSIHYWGSQETSWPGKVMHLEETLSDGRQVWSYEINISSLTGFMFARTSAGATEGSSGTDWGAKTKDLSPAALGTNNCVIMTNTTESWGDPGCDVTYANYVPGKTNY